MALSCEGVQACRLPALKPVKYPAAALTRQPGHRHSGDRHFLLEPCSHPFASRARRCSDIEACRLPGFKPFKSPAAASTRHSSHSCLLLCLHVCRRSGHSHLLLCVHACRSPTASAASAYFISFFFFAFLSGTCQCFFWHHFPDGVSCVTAMRPHDCDDQTTVEHTGQLCA